MGSYSFTNAAIQDIDKICEYIARQNSQAASQLFDVIRKKCKLIANFPNMGKSYSKVAPDLRGFVVENYIIFYYPKKDGINIARVVSGYQDLELLFLENK